MRKVLLIGVIIISINGYTQSNFALSFDGTNDFVSIPHNAALNMTDFTLEAWVNLPSAATAIFTIVSKGDGITGPLTNYLFNIGSNVGNGKIGLFAGNAWYNASTTLSNGIWYHVAVTVSGTAVKFYLNGVSDGTAVLSSGMFTGGTYSLKLGEQGDNCACNRMNGMIDEVRIWNVARTQSEIISTIYGKGLSNSATGLVAYYPMNFGSGTVLSNASTNTAGIDGTLTNGPTWPASPVQFAGNGLNIDGVNDVVVLPQSVSSDFTVEYWMKTTFTGLAGGQWYNGNGIVDAEVGGVTADWGTSETGNQLAFGIGQPDVTIKSTTLINTGNWIHVAATWKQSTGAMVLYINGTQEATGTSGTALRSVPTRITLGELQTNIHFWSGSIDELRIWNVVRTPAQIQANRYKELDPVAEPNLTAYYSFNQGIASGTNTGLANVIDQKGARTGTLSSFSLTGATSNFVVQNNNLFVLPLQWLSFTARKQGAAALLNWSTANEQNTRDFVVQHSNNGIDWENIATIGARGNTNTVSDYQYVHSAPAKGNNLYRILQSDINGQKSYSEIRSVKFNQGAISFTLLANPVRSGNLNLVVNQINTFSLFNAEGRLIWKNELKPGLQTINVRNFSMGIYFLKTNEQVEKVVIR